MKILRPAFPRSVGSCIGALFWTSVAGSLVAGLVKFVNFINRLEQPRLAIKPAAEQFVISAVMVGFGIIAALAALQCLLSLLTTRYTLSATELTVDRGALWRQTTTLPLLSILRIETASGPLMRLFGLADLQVYAVPTTDSNRQGIRELPAVTLKGLQNGEEIRRLLLDRRASLHEAALRGDLMVGHSPQEVQFQRLADAIDRLNQRLPRT